jgi:hypothetical protein
MTSLIVSGVRYGLPALLVSVGVVMLVADPGGNGLKAAVFLGAADCMLAVNFMLRYSAAGDHDREEEGAARRFFDEHGSWPNEAIARAPRVGEPRQDRADPPSEGHRAGHGPADGACSGRRDATMALR